jgi:hypothetical protein
MTSSSSPRYRDFLRKVVDNVWAGPRDRLTTNWPRQFGFPTALSVGTVGQTRSALNLSLPGRAGTVLTRPEARIDPGSRWRTGFPSHCTGQASATYWLARIDHDPRDRCCLPRRTEASAKAVRKLE